MKHTHTHTHTHRERERERTNTTRQTRAVADDPHVSTTKPEIKGQRESCRALCKQLLSKTAGPGCSQFTHTHTHTHTHTRIPTHRMNSLPKYNKTCKVLFFSQIKGGVAVSRWSQQRPSTSPMPLWHSRWLSELSSDQQSSLLIC